MIFFQIELYPWFQTNSSKKPASCKLPSELKWEGPKKAIAMQVSKKNNPNAFSSPIPSPSFPFPAPSHIQSGRSLGQKT